MSVPSDIDAIESFSKCTANSCASSVILFPHAHMHTKTEGVYSVHVYTLANLCLGEMEYNNSTPSHHLLAVT